MMRRSTAGAAAIVAALLVSTTAASPAAAEVGADGYWYFDVFKIQNAHDAGITGEGVTVAVIDGQINLEVPTLQGADIEVQPSVCWDESGEPVPPATTDILADHGTNIVSYLVGTGAGYPGQTGVKGIAPDAKILFFSAGRETEEDTNYCATESGELDVEGDQKHAMGHAIFRAVDADVDIISISLSGGSHAYLTLAIAHALNAGIVVIVSIRNESFFDEGFEGGDGLFPSGYNGVVGVHAADSNAVTMENHFDPKTDVLGPGVGVVWQSGSTWEEQIYARGNSIATPIVAGMLALVAQKYPDATGNQLIQTLIRNTGVEDHELYYDPTGSVGYGSASATHMLRVDPTQYEDVNPLIVDGPDGFPSRDEIDNPIDEEDWDLFGVPAEEEPEEQPGEPSPAAEINLLPVLVAGGVLLLVVLVVTLIIVLATRRARATRTTPPA